MKRQSAAGDGSGAGRKSKRLGHPAPVGVRETGPQPSPIDVRIGGKPSVWSALPLRFRTHLPGLVLFFVVLAVFSPVLRHGFICYDDNGYVTANPQVQSGLNWTSLRWAFGAGPRDARAVALEPTP